MKIKVLYFEESSHLISVPQAEMTIGFIDDQNNPIVTIDVKYVADGKSFIITDYLSRRLYLDSIIDWQNISEEVENKLLAFDLKYDIDIK